MQKSDLVNAIHATTTKFAYVVTGGGLSCLGDLSGEGGLSNTLIEWQTPYDMAATYNYLGFQPDKLCSMETARHLAVRAFQRAYMLTGDKQVVGIGASSALAKQGQERSDRKHFVYVAGHSLQQTKGWAIELKSDRVSEEKLNSDLILNLTSDFCSLPGRVSLDSNIIVDFQTYSQQDAIVPLSIGHLYIGDLGFVSANNITPRAILCGSFNPLHRGHLKMKEIAEDILLTRVMFEFSIVNAAKPPLDYLEIAARVKDMNPYDFVISNAATFLEKSRIYPGCTFLVGEDTARRICDPKYRPESIEEVIAGIAQNDCRFLVYGRAIDGVYRDGTDLLPSFMKIATFVKDFREDISSTQLRNESIIN